MLPHTGPRGPKTYESDFLVATCTSSTPSKVQIVGCQSEAVQSMCGWVVLQTYQPGDARHRTVRTLKTLKVLVQLQTSVHVHTTLYISTDMLTVPGPILVQRNFQHMHNRQTNKTRHTPHGVVGHPTILRTTLSAAQNSNHRLL